MAVQQRKKSKQKCRQRKASKRYQGIESSVCSNCGAPAMPHRVCKSCGYYKGKQVTDIVVD